jgi:hypothetical protein
MKDDRDHDQLDLEAPRERAAGRRNADFEPITVARFWKNRRGEAIAVTVKSYKGRPLVDVRQFFTDHEGKLAPTRKGIVLAIARLPELAVALVKAVETARKRGLLPAEGAR